MNHHTASGSGGGEFPSLGTVISGRIGIPGPLCNLLVGRLRQGRLLSRVYVIADGRANDSGIGVGSVLDWIRSGRQPAGDATSEGSTNGNPWFYDIEVENNGVGEPYPAGQLATLIRCNAAIAKAEGWADDAHWALHHREWTSRKVDMSWRGDLRGRIAAYLRGDDMPLTDADAELVARKIFATLYDPNRNDSLLKMAVHQDAYFRATTSGTFTDTPGDSQPNSIQAVLNQLGAVAAAVTDLAAKVAAMGGTAPVPPAGGSLSGTFTATYAGPEVAGPSAGPSAASAIDTNAGGNYG